MKKASDIFETLRKQLHAPNFQNSFKMSPKAFSRCRLLPFSTMVSFVLNLLKQSIPKELNIFSKLIHGKRPTRSAVTQARAKLSPQVFVELNRTLIQEFYTENDFKTFEGFILLVIDGSTGQLPNSPELLEKYHYSSNQTESKMAMARFSFLYDALNDLTWNSKIKPYNSSERDIAIEHFESIKNLQIDLKKILVIFDRGYPSIALMYYLQQNGFHFLIRSGKGFLKEVNEVVNKNKKDTILEIPLKKASVASKKELSLKFPNLDLNNSLEFRVVVVELNTGEQEVLLTSLTCKKTYPYKIFLNLYFNRWRIEEEYKFYKCGVEIENFSGESSLIIEQDFHATVLATNAHALLKLEANQEIRDEEAVKKYEYNVNKRVSIKELKNNFVEMLLNVESNVEAFCEGIKATMKKDLIPVRPGRNFTRIRKYPHRKYHMNQR